MTSFIGDIAAAVEAVGIDKPGLVMGLALTDWESEQQRDEFLQKVTSNG